MRVLRDVAYAAVDSVEPSLLSLDVYMPSATDDTVSDTKHPVVVYVHGGGWRRGDKGRVGKKAELFVGLGAVLVSVNYRLVPEGFHPVNAMDVASAVAYVQAHAGQWGGNGDQLLLIGHSAGAHLAALVAAAPELLVDAGADPEAVRGCVVLDTQALDVERMMQTGGSANPLYAAAFGDEPEVWRDASPYWRLQRESSVPPFLLVVAGSNPRKLDQARRLVERLRTVGSDGAVIEAPEHTHKTLNQQLGADGDGPTAAVVEFFTEPLRMVQARAAQRELAEPGPFAWTPSLTFDAASAADPLEVPLPNLVLNLTTHRGRLYAGAGATFEAMQYSGGRASVFVKPAADADWQVDQIFDERTFRVGAMASVRFGRGGDGEEKGPRRLWSADTGLESRF
jgi:acetyl esterase/lipase